MGGERRARGAGRGAGRGRTGGGRRGRGRFVAVIILAMENRSCCTHECADAAGGGREGQQRAARSGSTRTSTRDRRECMRKHASIHWLMTELLLIAADD